VILSNENEYPTSLSSEVNNVTVLEDGEDKIKCGKVKYSGELTKASEGLTLTPSYSECKGSIEGTESAATVSPGSCKIELSGLQEGVETGGEVTELTAKESVGPSPCGAIKIEVTSASCTFEVSAQGPVSGASIKPDAEEAEGEPLEVSAKFSEANVTFTKGCEKSPCPKMKLQAKSPFSGIGDEIGALVAAPFKKIAADFANAKLTFLVKGVKAVEDKLPESTNDTIEVRNQSNWMLVVVQKETEGNNKWVYKNLAGQKGEFCGSTVFGALELPTRYGRFIEKSCKFEVVSPAEKPTENKYKLRGALDPLGEIAFKT
jgi:hypothetical protein